MSPISEFRATPNQENVTARLHLLQNSTGDPSPPSVIYLRRTDVLIGRSTKSEYVLKSKEISRKHCKFEWKDDRWFIRDLSSNGLIIDSKNSLKNELHPLLHGSVLELLPCQTGPGLAYKFLEMSPTGNVLQPLTDSDSNVNKILTTIDKNAQDLIINSVRNHLEQLDVSKLTETSCTKEEVTQVKDSDATNKFAKFLESHLTCVICSDVFIEPVTSPCGHTHCGGCITTWLQEKEECPTCRSLVTREDPPKKNLVMTNLLEEFYTMLGPEEEDRRRRLVAERNVEIPKIGKVDKDKDSEVGVAEGQNTGPSYDVNNMNENTLLLLWAGRRLPRQ